MEALYLLIPLSVLAVFVAAWVFLWMSDSGQFDDMDGPAWSVLHDDDSTAPSTSVAPRAERVEAAETDAAQQPPCAPEIDTAQKRHNPCRDNSEVLFGSGNERFNGGNGRG